jgi:ABC-2 type transport system ATP-binding protein
LTENIIEISNLVKSFDQIKAVNNISFKIQRNEIFGLVGPDGAGKTTTVRLLCGLLQPDSGDVKILGYSLTKQIKNIKKEIGYLSQKFSLYGDLTVDENIEFFAEIHGVKKYNQRRNKLLNFMRLTNFRKFPAGRLSGGMKQKLALACTLIHTPKIIFLDEPTTGVDPVSRRDFWKILSNLLKDGMTIVISTPYLDEAERFNRIVLLSEGKVLKYDTPDNIKSSQKMKILEIITQDIRKSYQLIISKSKYQTQIFGDRIDIGIRNDISDIKEIENLLTINNISIIDKRIKPLTLENVFFNLLEN